MPSTDPVDVLIVGAGPVGLFLATECARRKLSYRVVEAHAGQSVHSKALAIFPRTFEIFDMAGISQPFLQAANRVTGIAFVSHQRELGRIEFTPEGTPYPFVAMVPQDVTERLLMERLRGAGGSVEYETTLVSAHDAGDGAEAVLQHNGTSAVAQAKYVVGCDGAHSTVRNLLGLQFDGGEYAEQYMLADVMTNAPFPGDEMQLCPSQYGPLAIFPISANRRRLVATIDYVQGDAPSLELVNDLLTQRAPEGMKAESLVWSSYFKIHHRSVSQMSAGRMFVAGDAAHIHSPFGGQGMNTGLGDAWNLAWKLDLAVRGKAADALLPSYSQERRPIVRGVIETTHFLTSGLGARNPLARGVRDRIIPFVTHMPALRSAFVERLSGLATTYKGSPIVAGDGRRYFEERFAGGKICSKFILLTPDPDNPAARAVQTRFTDALETRTNGSTGLMLVRPDGYVALERTHADPAAFDAAQEVLARQTR